MANAICIRNDKIHRYLFGRARETKRGKVRENTREQNFYLSCLCQCEFAQTIQKCWQKVSHSAVKKVISAERLGGAVTMSTLFDSRERYSGILFAIYCVFLVLWHMLLLDAGCCCFWHLICKLIKVNKTSSTATTTTLIEQLHIHHRRDTGCTKCRQIFWSRPHAVCVACHNF